MGSNISPKMDTQRGYSAGTPHFPKEGAANHLAGMCRLDEGDAAIRRRKWVRVGAQCAMPIPTIGPGGTGNSRAGRRGPCALVTAQQCVCARPHFTVAAMRSFLRKSGGCKLADMNKGQALNGRNALVGQEESTGGGGDPADREEKGAADGGRTASLPGRWDSQEKGAVRGGGNS